MAHKLLIEDMVRAALLEDLGRRGDVTTLSTIAKNRSGAAAINMRQSGVVAGLDCAMAAFFLIDPDLTLTPYANDGDMLNAGDPVLKISGAARSILSGERVALNFMGHLSGIATQTRHLVDSIAHTKARICDTRKTLPGLRAVQKAAVLAGGGANHRFGLDDAVLIKDNHIALAGSIPAAVESARAACGHMTKIEVEVDTLEQLEILLETSADAVLLDNMTPEELKKAVSIVAGRMVCEASGGITPETLIRVAESGVDLISMGWLTHSVRALDVGLDIEL